MDGYAINYYIKRKQHAYTRDPNLMISIPINRLNGMNIFGMILYECLLPALH